MKKMIVIIAMIFFFLGNIYPENDLLINSYNAIYSKVKYHTSLPKIYKKKNAYITIDDKKEAFNWVLRVFDKKNYYIELAFEGADGTCYVYFAVYLSIDKKPVAGVSVISQSLDSVRSYYVFYKINGIFVVDVTDKVMPKIVLEDFFPKKYDITDVPLSLFCELPKKGTITKIKLISSYSEDSLDDKNIKNKVENALSSANKKSFSFKWNYNKGMLELIK